MRYFLVLLFLASVQLPARAQNWSPPGAKWTYSFGNAFGMIGYTEITYTGDTLLNVHSYKKLDIWQHYFNYQSGHYNDDHVRTEISYEQGGVVYVKDQSQFDTLYNFNASIGDTWRMVGYLNYQQNFYVSVVDTGKMMIYGNFYKYIVLDLHATFFGDNQHTVRDTAVEKIGFLHNYMFPTDPLLAMVDGNEGGPFRCYSDDHFPTWKPYYNKSCDFIVPAVVNAVSPSLNDVYPNPVKDELYIGTNTMAGLQYELLGIDGSLIMKGQSSGNRVDCSALRPGCYVLVTFSESKLPGHYRFIKE